MIINPDPRQKIPGALEAQTGTRLTMPNSATILPAEQTVSTIATALSNRAIAAGLLGQIAWQDDNTGFCRCPGQRFHTRPDGKQDCRVMLDRVPTVHCVHSSCAPEIHRVNHAFRSAIAKAASHQECRPGKRWRPTVEEQRRRATRAASECLKLRAKASLAAVLESFAKAPAQLFEESPVRLAGDPESDWRLLLQLFPVEDVVWIGDKFDSGIGHESNFRQVADWLTGPAAPAPLICPNSFKPGVNSRCNENIVRSRFLVIESDVLSKPQIAAVFTWCRQFLRLRAIVDTAGKSLHGWFDYPTAGQLTELKAILPKFGCDPALFTPSQPCRLPGARRGSKIQALMFLDLEGPGHE